jgi:hypothetical protein
MGEPTPRARPERQARNEGLVRLVNEQIDALDQQAEEQGWPPPDRRFDFHCECGREGGCPAMVAMTLEEYDRVRSEDDRFALLPGHENPEIERVVERHEHFLIVDKKSQVEPLVENDPRGAASQSS